MYSKGISWIDDCRIPYTKTDKETINFDRPRVRELKEDRDWILTQAHDFTNPDFKEYNTDGRFPANLLVCDDMLNDGVITKQNPRKYKADLDIQETSLLGFGDTRDKIQMGDSGSSSRYYNIDKWFDKIINYE
jgi:hypothetical protein